MSPGRGSEPHREVVPSVRAILMFIVLLASYSINAMERQIFPLVAPDVRREYGFSLAQAGFLSTVFTLGMAIAGIPTGYLLSRFPRKAVFQLGIAVFSATTVLTATARGFPDMFLYRALTGVGEAMQFTTLLIITAAFFVRSRSTAIGAVNVFFGIGAITGPIMGARLLSYYHTWRAPLVLFGSFGLVAIAAVRFGVVSTLTESRSSPENAAKRGGADTLANRNTIILTVLSAVAGLIMYGYLGMYPTFLREYLHFSPRDAGFIMSMYGLGGLTSMAGGWLGDRFSAPSVLSAGFLGLACIGYLLFHGPRSFATQAALSFLWATLASGTIYVNLGACHVKAVSGTLTNQASGIFVTSFYTCAAVAGYSIGSLANHNGWMAAGTIQLSMLSILAACLALGLRLWRDDPVRS